MRGGLDISRLAPGLLDVTLGFLRVLVLFEIGNQDISTLTRIRNGNGSTYAAVGTGNHGSLTKASAAFGAAEGWRGMLGGQTSPPPDQNGNAIKTPPFRHDAARG